MTDLKPGDITKVAIHPAIGIARMGNSPEGFFIGPEIPGVPPAPTGGKFKDDVYRVKRQAARFRCFGYHAKRNEWIELRHGGPVRIEWTVQLRNKKAAADKFNASGRRNDWDDNRSNLIINPDPLRLTARNGSAVFEERPITFHKERGKLPLTEKVGLGEIRTEADGHLLVLGGHGAAGSPHRTCAEDSFNNDGWWDDSSDGPVDAVVHIDGVGGVPGDKLPAERAWVIVTPPKFAPQLDTVVTLWDQLTDFFGLWDGRSSYVRDIQPLLRRAHSMRWVHEGAFEHHGQWPEPLYGYYERRKIDSWLRPGPGEKKPPMPVMNSLNGREGHLTKSQLKALALWRADKFERDWTKDATPSTTITPAGLDRAALVSRVLESQ